MRRCTATGRRCWTSESQQLPAHSTYCVVLLAWPGLAWVGLPAWPAWPNRALLRAAVHALPTKLPLHHAALAQTPPPSAPLPARYAQLYRGAVDPEAAAARLAWAEKVGRSASKLGAEVEERCWREQGAQGQCWWVGRDAARQAVEAARQAQQASDSGGDGGTPASNSGR